VRAKGDAPFDTTQLLPVMISPALARWANRGIKRIKESLSRRRRAVVD
jgi:hypothetical protein